MLNKRGGIADIFIFIVVGLILVLVFGVILYFYMQAAPTFQATFSNTIAQDGSNYSGVYSDTIGVTYSSVQLMKWGVTAIFLTMILSILLGSLLVNVHPIFLIAYVIVAIIATVVSIPLANLYETISLDPILASTLEGFWGMNFLYINLPYIVMITMAFAGIIMFINYLRKRDTAPVGGYV